MRLLAIYMRLKVRMDQRAQAGQIRLAQAKRWRGWMMDHHMIYHHPLAGLTY